jgi:ribosomal protein S18 acetylase RimI-like enzyme
MTQYAIYQIEAYTHEHDAGLAEMWNASDQQWPGGFTRGVPFTTERIADWMDKQKTLMRLVVKAPNGEVVGYGSLWDEPSQPGRSCYVDLLNVHPDHQRRSLCRRMLTQMVEYATEHGYNRMSIGTWAANLKAVPLYKKVGFNWKPNTSVYMENYIPQVRRLPILRDFFAQADWYADHTRELLQVEDDHRHPQTGAMEVYRCRWVRPDGEAIEAVIDRQAQTVTGLETSDFAAYARVVESKPAQGLSYPIFWEMTNKRNRPMTVQLEASGDEQVELACAEHFTLAPGETRVVEGRFCCSIEAPRLDIWSWRPKPTPQIRSRLLLDGEELWLGAGLHYQPALDISLHPTPPTLVPGMGQMVMVQIKNHLDRPLQGELQVADAAGLTLSWQKHPFTVEANGATSAPLQLRAEAAGAMVLKLSAIFQTDGEPLASAKVHIAPQPLPILVRKVGMVAAILHKPDANQVELHVENDFFHLGAERRAGQMWINNKAGQEYHLNLRETIGPPYTPSEFEQSDFDLDLQQSAGRVQATFQVASANFPGLTLGRQVVISASPLVEVRQWLQNDGPTPHTCKIQTSLNLPDNFAVSGLAAMPRQDGLVTALSNVMPEAEGDFPRQPAGMAEQWIAYTVDGETHGVVWNADVVDHEWRPWFFNLISAEYTVPPHSRVEVSPLYLYCGPGDWRTVRRIWQQCNGQTTQALLDHSAMPIARPPQRLLLTPNPALMLTDQVTIQLQAENLRQQPIRGRIVVTPPSGWSAEPSELAVDDLRLGAPIQATLRLDSGHVRLGPSVGQVQLQGESFDVTQPLTILRVGEQGQVVQVTQEQAADQPLWAIDNGCMRWSVAPAYHAGVTAWRDSGGAVNHLYTAFPEEGEFDWMKPWFGGIRPTLGSQEGGWPGKLHLERFATSVLERLDSQGLPWRGVRLAAEIQGQKKLKGLSVEIDYLTLTGSNLLKASLRLINNTPVYHNAWNPWLAFMLYCQVDGAYANAELYGESPHVGAVQRKRSSHHQWLRVGNWAAVVNPSSGRALTVVCPSQPNSINLMNTGEHGGHLMVNQSRMIAPHGTNELVIYVALVESLEQARPYIELATLPPL